MTLSAISIARLAQVEPHLAERIRQLDALAPELSIQVTQGLRTWNQQNELYSEGRNGNPGSIVTDAPAGYSWHNYALAIDVVPEDIEPGQPDWNISHPAWQRIVSLAPTVGLFSGSKFRTFPDWPHLQPQELPESPTDEDRQDFTDAGTQAVWDKYFPPQS
jgi:peptidoglycan LD-endopeptidase CwlK